MKVNWKVRAKNKFFWLALVPAFLLVLQIVTGWFGYELAADLIGEEATNFINAVFGLLVILGIVVDHTTDGVDDSDQAMNYDKPRKKGDK
ncbi:phage holin [Sporosarcina sp. P37]|uniref:phage holin n=1 Tax=unclassified Sporosarcina TaxID=2647733 RepID=UPI000A17E7A1|nr:MULTISPECIES: phage holin [unclassified Sporosarcina]ARK26022.1 phage holin [Sporosarcina sp. P37]PID19391.1 phage holin [Sporosarcina sp. P35]